MVRSWGKRHCLQIHTCWYASMQRTLHVFWEWGGKVCEMSLFSIQRSCLLCCFYCHTFCFVFGFFWDCCCPMISHGDWLSAYMWKQIRRSHIVVSNREAVVCAALNQVMWPAVMWPTSPTLLKAEGLRPDFFFFYGPGNDICWTGHKYFTQSFNVFLSKLEPYIIPLKSPPHFHTPWYQLTVYWPSVTPAKF